MRYIGIDLAWGAKNTTGAVVLDGSDDPAQGATLLAHADALLSDADILAFVDKYDTGGGLLVALDAPTIVPNVTGRRPCEAILSSCLRAREAGPHPANRTLLGKYSSDHSLRGERIAHALAMRGLPQTPFLDTLLFPPRAAFEVFPHPAHVALFGLPKTLKYKAKPNRTLDNRLREFRRYALLLQSLQTADPPLHLSPDKDLWLRRDPAERTRPLSALKQWEDALDALTCAYVALYRFRWGNEKCPVVGDLTHGFIVTPADAAMQECFRHVGNQTT